MTLLLLLFTYPTDADKVLARYTAFMRSANTLSVQVRAHPGGDATYGVGTLTFQRPARLFFTMTSKGTEYLCTLNEDGGMDQDKTRKMYDEYPSPGVLRMVNSLLSPIPSYGLPYPLLDDNLRSLVPSGFPFKSKGKVKIGGVQADVVSAHYGSSGQSGDIVATIDPKGRLLRLTIFRETPRGNIDLRYDLSNYVINAPVPASRFTLDIPKGYVPYTMPAAPDPVSAGDPLPLGTWASTSSDGRVDLAALAHGKPALIVVADPDSTPSALLLKAIAPSAQKTKDSGGVFAVVSTTRDKAGAQRLGVTGTLFDPTGSHLRRLRLPGTPLVYLVGRDAKVVQAWFGYDSAADAAFQKELTEALGKAGVK